MVDIFSHGRIPILAVSRLHLIDPSSIEHNSACSVDYYVKISPRLIPCSSYLARPTFALVLYIMPRIFYTVSQKNDTALACYNFDMHHPILIFWQKCLAKMFFLRSNVYLAVTKKA